MADVTTTPRDRSDLLVPYWLRSVRIGVRVTWLELATLVALPFLPGHGHVDAAAYAAVIAAAAGGAVVIMSLPWRRLFDRGLGIWFLYGWSAGDIVLISVAVAVTGGGRSDLFLAYFLTTVFFGVSYPPRGQRTLLAFTFACYAASLLITGWNLSPAAAFLRFGSIGILALLTSFLSRELVRQMETTQGARERSDRWAALLGTVARAGRSMTLDPEHVLDVVMDAVSEMGFEGVSLCRFDAGGETYRVVRSREMPDGYASRSYRANEGVTGMVRSGGQTVVLDDYSVHPGGVPLVQAAGYHAAIAAPVWVEGRLEAVLSAGTKERRSVSAEEVEAIELLAGQAGMAFENVATFQEKQSAVRRLEELDRLKSDFLTTASHELRTPITVIQGSGLTLENAWSSLDDAARLELLRAVNGNARALAGIVNTLLDFSRLEGKANAELAPFDLSSLVRECVDRLRPLFAGRALTCLVPPETWARGDASLIERVIENLLSNAAKHTPQDTSVVVAVRRRGDEVVVAVRDYGRGIDGADLPHLGERFFRAGDVNTRARGMGLGLALVGEILQLHGSSLQAASASGMGATFQFALAAAEPPATGARAATS